MPVDDYWRPLDPVIADGVAAAIAALEKAGAQIVEVRTPMIDELATAYPVIVGNEAYATHAAWLAERPDDYQPLIRERLLAMAGRPAKEYIDAQRTRRRLVPQFRAAVEWVLLIPIAIGIRFPGMHGRQPHFGAISDQHQDEGGVEPDRRKFCGITLQRFQEKGRRQAGKPDAKVLLNHLNATRQQVREIFERVLR